MVCVPLSNHWQLRVMQFDAPHEHPIADATYGYFSMAAQTLLVGEYEQNFHKTADDRWESEDGTITARVVHIDEPILANSKDTGYSI